MQSYVLKFWIRKKLSFKYIARSTEKKHLFFLIFNDIASNVIVVYLPTYRSYNLRTIKQHEL